MSFKKFVFKYELHHVLLFRHFFQVLGDGVLEGIPVRSSTIVAVTNCQFAVLDAADYAKIRDRGHTQMSLDEKCHHLK